MRIIIKDDVKYLPHIYESESELENLVKKHVDIIFGDNAILFSKSKIKSKAGISTIPDGFVLIPTEERWFIIEIELSYHPLYEHIVPQLTKFYNAIKNYNMKRKLVEIFYNEIKANTKIECKFELSDLKEELYKAITDTVNRSPEIVIIIDAKTKELEEICDALPFSVKVLEFKTYYRENSNVSIYLLDSLKDYTKKPVKITLKEELYSQTDIGNLSKSYGEETLNQILDVVELVFQGRSYSEAVKIVASKRKIREATVRDKCTRRVGLKTDEFKDLLTNKEKLIEFLIKKFPNKKEIIKERLGG